MVAIGTDRINGVCALAGMMVMVAVAVVMAVTVTEPRDMHMRTFVMLRRIAICMRMGNRRQLIGDEADDQQE